MTQIDSSEVGGLTIHADFDGRPSICPHCGSEAPARRHGQMEATYRDAPFLGQQVAIRVNVQRFRCPDCGHAFFQDLPSMHGKRRMTARCSDYLFDQVMARSSIKDVARIVGVDEKTVRNGFTDRGVIFTVGDPPNDDRFVCECCLGLRQKSELRLASPKHFGRWRANDLLREANVCNDCFGYDRDPWRAGIVRRLAQ